LKFDQFNKYAFSDPNPPFSKVAMTLDQDIPETQERIDEINRMIQGITPDWLANIAKECADKGSSAYNNKIRGQMLHESQL